MESYIVFILVSLTLDYVLFLSLKRLFRLESGNVCIFLLQILNVSAGAIFLVLELKFYQFLLMKILAYFLICLLITNNYKFSKFIPFFFLSLVMMFSYYGFSKFLVMFVRALFIQIFSKNLSKICDLVIVFAILCYIFALFKIIDAFSKNKILNTFLRKVSFFAFGKHIEFMGLLDSGNVLYDSKTKLPVIIVSVYSLKKYLPQKDYKNITNCNYDNLAVSHYLKVVTIANKNFDIPIFDIKKVSVYFGTEKRSFRCVLGVVSHRFESSNRYDCLLHRDFV
ncbi:MAG: sigma-E processing peptidase SpoIIGA [Clostridia bacterium]|nr:sigma-E processing peptidase SpoIIGA [Clostridia bacterium]